MIGPDHEIRNRLARFSWIPYGQLFVRRCNCLSTMAARREDSTPLLSSPGQILIQFYSRSSHCLHADPDPVLLAVLTLCLHADHDPVLLPVLTTYLHSYPDPFLLLVPTTCLRTLYPLDLSRCCAISVL